MFLHALGGWPLGGGFPGATRALPADLLAAIVAYLKGVDAVTSLLSDPDAVAVGLSNWGAEMPFLLAVDYTEVSPGESADDQHAAISVVAYAGTVPAVRAIMKAVAAALDSPNLNEGSSRDAQFAWARGTSTGVVRGRTRVAREPGLSRRGELAYAGRADYRVYMTPSQ